MHPVSETFKNRKTKSIGCMSIIFILYLITGIVAGSVWLRSVYRWIDAQFWITRPATLQQVEMVRELNPGKKNFQYVYTVAARYQYEFEGNTYVSEQTYLQKGKDSNFYFHQQNYDFLRSCLDSGEPTLCYINPKKPSDSVLIPMFRWDHAVIFLTFLTIYCGIGLFAFYYLYISYKQIGFYEPVRKEDHPDEPWLWRKEWAKGIILSGNLREMTKYTIIAIGWHSTSIGLIIRTLMDYPYDRNKGPYIGLVLILGGSFFIVRAYRAIRYWRRFGESFFHLETLPGSIGGRLKGVVRTSVPFQPDQEFEVTLSCLKRSNNQPKPVEEVYWENHETIKGTLITKDTPHTEIPIHFHIPADAKESNPNLKHGKPYWLLDIKAKTGGADYKSQFIVPVFKTDGVASTLNPLYK